MDVMVTLLLDHSRLELVLSPTERLLASHRSNIRVERSSIVKVQLTDDPWAWLRGARSRGTAISGTVAMGTWRFASGDDFVAIRRRGRPGVAIDLEGDEDFQRLLVTTRHGIALVRALRLDLDEAGDVASLAAQAKKPAKGRRKGIPRPVPAV
jgi:hypothetical protein